MTQGKFAGGLLAIALALPLAATAQAPTTAPAVAAGPATVRVHYAGVTLNLPIPPGYCEIPRTGEGALFYQLQQHGNVGMNVVAVLFADCGDWRKREHDQNYRLRRHGSYLLQLSNGAETLAPVEYTRATYVKQVSGLKLENEDLRKGINEKVDTSGLDAGKLNSLSIRPLAVDARAAYLTGVSEVQFPHGKAVVCALIGATLVKRIPVSINSYRDYEGTPSILAALEEQKANMRRLDEANP